MENGETCKTCHDDRCNHKQYFPECFVTNGEIEIQNEQVGDGKKRKICADYNDVCFVSSPSQTTVIRDCLKGYAKRNDLSEKILSEKFKPSNYVICDTPLCNNHELKPTVCISCNSHTDDNCFNTTSAERKDCPLELSPSGCYHFQGNVVHRGCMADLDDATRKLCESDSETCKRCVGDECNSKTLFQKCLIANDMDSTHSETCKRYTDECYIAVFNDSIRRGCTSDLIESPFQAMELISICTNNELCETCSGTNDCNDRQLKIEHCLVCTSEGDIYCKYYPSEKFSQKCPLALKEMGCYLSKTGLDIQRGCISELDSERREYCQRDDGTCRMCRGENCNKKTNFQECVDCDSKTDKSCMDSPFRAFGRVCPGYYGQCYTLVRDGAVIRNCTGDQHISMPNECKGDECKLCSNQGNCNDRPIEQLTCITCNSKNSDCSTDTSQSELCTLTSVHPQSCYHFIGRTGKHDRGDLDYRKLFFKQIIFC